MLFRIHGLLFHREITNCYLVLNQTLASEKGERKPHRPDTLTAAVCDFWPLKEEDPEGPGASRSNQKLNSLELTNLTHRNRRLTEYKLRSHVDPSLKARLCKSYLLCSLGKLLPSLTASFLLLMNKTAPFWEWGIGILIYQVIVKVRWFM